jgi:glycosyltransferase involved in cell wall biosynthesis
MRVLLITQYFWPENFIINHVARGMVERGITVDVLTGMPNYPQGAFYDGYGGMRTRREHHEGIEVVRVPMIPRGKRKAQLAINYMSFAASASLFGPAMLRDKYDVSLVYAPSPATVALVGLAFKRLRQIPLVYWVQDLWPDSLDAAGAPEWPLLHRTVAGMMRRIYRGSDCVLVPSMGFVDSVVAAGGDEAKIKFLPNTVEDFYQPVSVPQNAPESHEFPSDGFNIVFGGNIGEAQDFETVIDAAEITRHRGDIRWILIGDGRKREMIEADVRRRNLTDTVRLLGARPSSTMPIYFALADALLLTLRADPAFSRTIPSKLQAYFACGKPVIAGVNGEVARIVSQAKAGVISASGDPQALANAALRLSEASEDERKRMGENARGYYNSHYTRGRVLDQLIQLLSQVVQSNAT